ncbi:hypothetical protein PIB30_072168 [Stylosanthes scabra]|uniref:Uncharacterized protein n=1 Tax=Stylosanthes scabra TaxID=79078 RepID=A0ABU6WNL3_9FABA|nr:hypothetical protein [Stylosanthes scabra]
MVKDLGKSSKQRRGGKPKKDANLGGEIPVDLPFRGRGPKRYRRIIFRRNPNFLLLTPSQPPKPSRRHSPSSPHPNLRSPAVVLSVTASHGEGSLEYHQDPHLVGAVLGNGALNPTLAVTVSWRRRRDIAAATTTVEPLYSLPLATVDFSYNPEPAVGVFGRQNLQGSNFS